MKSPTMMWDFWSLNPESLHQVLILMSDRGTLRIPSYERLWQSYLFDAGRSEPAHLCEVSFQNSAGNQEFCNEEAAQMKARDMDFANVI
jgi:catalase